MVVHLRVPAIVLLELALCYPFTEALTNISTIVRPMSPLNSSLSVIPPGFSIRGVALEDSGGPMDEIGVFMNAVFVMEDLCFMDQGAQIMETKWSLPNYDIFCRIEANSHSQVRWAVYGLQLTVQFAATPDEGNFRPLLGCYSMHGSPKGTVEFGHRGYESNISILPGVAGPKNASMAVSKVYVDDDEDASLTFTDDDDDNTFPNSTTTATSLDTKTPVSTPQLEVIPTYNGETMTAKDVFAIALDVMVLGAEKGPAEPVSRITTRTFDMIPIHGAYGERGLRYKALVKTMRILTRWMVAQRRFAEVDIELGRDGVVIAIGRLKNGLRVGSQ